MATANQINAARLEEEKRSNRKQEDLKSKGLELERRSQNLSMFGRLAPILDKRIKFKGKLTGGNTPDWYNGNPQMAKDAGNLNYNAVAGSNPQIQSLNLEILSGTSVTAKQSVPGIMVLNYIPVLPHNGSDTYVTNDVLTAFQAQYVAIRKANSGAKNYDVSNYVSYVYALHGFCAAIADMSRAYSACLTYKDANAYFGKVLVEAMGYDYEDLSANLADFRLLLNSKMSAFNAAFKVPVVMPWFLRSMWMNSRVFKDSDIAQAQIYLYKPEGFYKYGDTSTFTTFVPRPSNFMTVQHCQNLLDNLFNAILYSEDAGNISGDVEREFGSDLFKLQLLTDSEQLEVVTDDLSLNQIQNIEFKGKIFDSSTLAISISLSDFTMRQKIQLVASSDSFPSSIVGGTNESGLLNNLNDKKHITISNDKDLTPPESLEISKCKAGGHFVKLATSDTSLGPSSRLHFIVNVCNTEVFTYGRIYYNEYTYTKDPVIMNTSRSLQFIDFGQIPVVGRDKSQPTLEGTYRSVTIISNLNRILSNFDWAPMLPWKILVANPSGDGYSTSVLSEQFYSGDIGRYAAYGDDILGNMNTAIVHSVFAIDKFST